MTNYHGVIEDFWSEYLPDYTYTRQVPFEGMRSDWHENYNRDYLLQAFNDELPPIWQQFYTALNAKEGSISWTCMLPNRIIPPHVDTFYTLRTKHNVDVSECFRYLIMLEDHKFGQYIQFDDLMIGTWKKGEVWSFDSTVKHFAVNASNDNFHTCQVSTIK